MAKPKTISEYIAAAPRTHRAGLKTLRAQVKRLYPKVTEHIRYGMPLFKLDNHPFVAMRAATHHSSLFVWSGTALAPVRKLLKAYDTSIGTVRFPPDKPLPLKLLKAILVSRAKEIKSRWG